MITSQARELILRLRAGAIDPKDTAALEGQPAFAFIADVRKLFPVEFQERRVGRKYEVGLARSIRQELTLINVAGSPFPVLLPEIRRCLFVSCYDDRLSEITYTSRILIRPTGEATGEVVLDMEPGNKLDRTPDGWVLKPLKKRAVTLTEAFLAKRGWNRTAFNLSSRETLP
jgi:hypothetical protein